MSFCFYRNRKKYFSTKLKKRSSTKEPILNDTIIKKEDLIDNLSNKRVTFDSNIKVHFIPRVKSQNSLIRDLLWYNYDELNKFYKDKKREIIWEDLKKTEDNFSKKISKLNKKTKSDLSMKISELTINKASRSNSI